VSALDGGVDLNSVPSDLRDQVDFFQAPDPDESEIPELVAKARDLVLDGSYDGLKGAMKSVLADRHAEAWYRYQDEYQEEQRDIELKQWQDRNENQERVAKQIADALPGVAFTQAAGGSWYADYKGLKLRISDHPQVSGGGFNQGTGERMGEADLQIIVDHESTVDLSPDRIRKKVSQQLRDLRNGNVESQTISESVLRYADDVVIEKSVAQRNGTPDES